MAKTFQHLIYFFTKGQRAFPWTSKSQRAFQQHPTLEDQVQITSSWFYSNLLQKVGFSGRPPRWGCCLRCGRQVQVRPSPPVLGQRVSPWRTCQHMKRGCKRARETLSTDLQLLSLYRDNSETILAANPNQPCRQVTPRRHRLKTLTISRRLGRSPSKLLSPSGGGGAGRGRATGVN